MSVKLIALDLDGTTFADDLVISERLRKAISDAQVSGVIVTIATGRMLAPARKFAADLHIDQPLICYQGALIAQSKTGEVLYHKTVPVEDTRSIIRETKARGLHLNLYLNDRLYVDHMTPEASYYARINMDLHINEVGDL